MKILAEYEYENSMQCNQLNISGQVGYTLHGMTKKLYPQSKRVQFKVTHSLIFIDHFIVVKLIIVAL